MNVQELTLYLKSIQFRPTSFKGSSRLAYIGTFSAGDQQIEVVIVFQNQFPSDFPKAYIKNWECNYELQKKIGLVNVNKDGELCYIDPDQIWWDSSKPLEFMQAVIDRISEILNQKAKQSIGEELFIRDFISYWGGKIIYSGIPTSEKKGYDLQIQDRLTWLKPGRKSCFEFFSLQINSFRLPNDYEHWPPSTLFEFIQWIEPIQSSYRLWIKYLVKRTQDLSKGRKTNKPLSLGFILHLKKSDSTISVPPIAIRFELNVQLLNALLGGRTKLLKYMSRSTKLQRYSIKQADPEFIYGRNMVEKKSILRNKKIAVVGAGAIGGFLCSQLACLGAGSGKRGKLIIIDNDTLEPENIGRHLLGMEFIAKSKAESVCSSITRNHPDLAIVPFDILFEDVIEKLQGDLIINATGMQTVGVTLETMQITRPSPLLHAWIEGQGACARTLLNDHKNTACFRCLWEQTTHGIYESTIPALKHGTKVEMTPVGCHQSYYAYPVMAAIKAATLASDAVIDFFKGSPTPRLRNLIIRQEQCLNSSDQNDPSKSTTCPVCQLQKEKSA